MATLRDKPYPNFNFLVDLGTGKTDGPEAGFEEVVLPEMSVDVIEYRNGNDKTNDTRKITGRARYGNAILRRGVCGSLALYQWYNQIRNGEVNVSRNVTIQLLGENRVAVQTWKLIGCKIVKIQWGPLNARGQDVAVESIELSTERMELE